MGAMELLQGYSPTTTKMSPLLLRNIASSLFVFLDDSLVFVAKNRSLVGIVRSVLASAFLFFLSLLPRSLINRQNDNNNATKQNDAVLMSPEETGSSGLARALSQLLSLAADVPTGSRKHEVVRYLADRLVNDNEIDGSLALREVNRAAVSAAFSRALGLLELGRAADAPTSSPRRRLWWRWCQGPAAPAGPAAEKLAAELLWLARKAAACGFGDEAVRRWASAGGLARLALSAEPRLQCSLVKLSAFLFKQGKDMGLNEEDETKREQHKQTKMKMLQSWLPLLCQATNGTDEPVLSSAERAELERVLEEMIEMLEDVDQQESVLSIWLHHFTHCSSSDWPNLQASYARWCDTSRKLLLNNCC